MEDSKAPNADDGIKFPQGALWLYAIAFGVVLIAMPFVISEVYEAIRFAYQFFFGGYPPKY